MFVVMDSEPMWLAFMLLSPVMLVGSALSMHRQSSPPAS